MAQLTLVVGGVRSGKSRFAEGLAAATPPLTYLATALPGDAEMAARIAAHRERRGPHWRTVEEPWDVAGAVAALLEPGAGQAAPGGCILVECLTLWVTNLLLGVPGHPGREDGDILAEVDALAPNARKGAARVVVVSNEVGCGVIPANALARRFGDLLGEANQRVAAAAAEVYACVAGIPLRIK